MRSQLLMPYLIHMVLYKRIIYIMWLPYILQQTEQAKFFFLNQFSFHLPASTEQKSLLYYEHPEEKIQAVDTSSAVATFAYWIHINMNEDMQGLHTLATAAWFFWPGQGWWSFPTQYMLGALVMYNIIILCYHWCLHVCLSVSLFAPLLPS